MNKLVEQLRKILASNFALYLKTHMFHWNVEGANFPEYHEFFSDVYEDLFDQSDVLAEYLRQLGEKAPGSLSVYAEQSVIKDEEGFPSVMDMFEKLQADTATMITLYQSLYDAAEEAREHQISNYAAERLGAHKKTAWMVRSILKK
jgi:starvation-inducible DNA-binding protein